MTSLHRSPLTSPFARTAQSKTQADCQIVPATEVSASDLESFYDKTFAERADFLKADWRWLYRVGEYDWASAPLVAIAEGKVIGFLGNIPAILKRDSTEYRAAWLVDLAILPEWQRRGTGMALVQKSMEHYPLLMGFGNEKSLGALLKCGWEVRFDTQSLQLLLRPEHHPKFLNSPRAGLAKTVGIATRATWKARTLLQKEITVERVSPENLSEFATHDYAGSLHVARSESFLRWRIVQSPLAEKHLVFSYQPGSKEKCRAIARISDESGFRRLHLLGLNVPLDRKKVIGDFLSGVISWAIKEDFHRVLMVASNPLLINVARWWLPVTTRLRFIYHAKDDAGWELLRSPEQIWECLDNDFDLT